MFLRLHYYFELSFSHIPYHEETFEKRYLSLRVETNIQQEHSFDFLFRNDNFHGRIYLQYVQKILLRHIC